MEDDMSPCENESASLSWSYVPRRRRIHPGDAFFDDGNFETSLAHKQMPIETDEEEEDHQIRHQDFNCHVMGCTQTFTTVTSYEIHYNGAHRNICRYCRRSYPSNHLLDIHILESHDSLFEIMCQKQPMFQCLVESCSEKFPDSQTRRDHLIKHHHYPANFRFQKGISKPRKQTTAKQTLNTAEDEMDIEAPTGSDTHSDTSLPQSGVSPATHGEKPLTTCLGRGASSECRTNRVPVNISFGRGGTRSFQRGHPKYRKPKKGNGHAQKQKGHAPDEEPMDVSLLEATHGAK